MGVLSINISPLSISYNLQIRFIRVDFPDPVLPVIPNVSIGFILKLISLAAIIPVSTYL